MRVQQALLPAEPHPQLFSPFCLFIFVSVFFFVYEHLLADCFKVTYSDRQPRSADFSSESASQGASGTKERNGRMHFQKPFLFSSVNRSRLWILGIAGWLGAVGAERAAAEGEEQGR